MTTCYLSPPATHHHLLPITTCYLTPPYTHHHLLLITTCYHHEFGVLVAIWAGFGGDFGALWRSFASCLGRMTAAGLIHRTIERLQVCTKTLISDVMKLSSSLITVHNVNLLQYHILNKIKIVRFFIVSLATMNQPET
jgi:hypothetical protein